MDSPINRSLFSLAKKNANAISINPISKDPRASKALFFVISDNTNATKAIIIPKSAAESSTTTVRTEVSLFSLNSLTIVEIDSLSPCPL
jgi:hypothetical protein